MRIDRCGLVVGDRSTVVVVVATPAAADRSTAVVAAAGVKRIDPIRQMTPIIVVDPDPC